MKIDHIAMWCKEIDVLRDFYVKYFEARANQKYVNEKKGFESYFLHFESGSRLELMSMPTIFESLREPQKQYTGLVHLAVSVGSEERVDQLTNELRDAGYVIVDEPRRTGDGYYESVVFDPENNRVEITV